MDDVKKAVFPCRKCHKNISVSRSEVEENIKSKGSFECPHCSAKNTKSADVYSRLTVT
jgi:DNA-directed RNA polymerase subunit RPC12/RpoP